MSAPLLAMHLDILAGISKRLRRRERKAFNELQMLRIQERLATSGLPQAQIQRVLKTAKKRVVRMIKDDSVSTADNSIIVPMPPPDEEWIKDAQFRGEAIHRARTVYLRRELRAGYLAYGFLRGLNIDAMETKAYEPIPFDRVEAIIKKYGSGGSDLQLSNSFAAWKADAITAGTHPKATEDAYRIARKIDNEGKFGTGLYL